MFMKRSSLRNLLIRIGILLLVPAFSAALAAGGPNRVVRIGDKCTVDYSCRLKDGTLLVTTLPSVADDPKIPKSDLFLELREYHPVDLLAGMDAIGAEPNAANTLVGRLDKKLAEAIVGLEAGKPSKVFLTSEAMPQPDGSSGEVRMKILRVRPIERTLSMAMFKRLSRGKDPSVGMELQLEPPGNRWGEPGGLMGRVAAVEGDNVRIKTLAKPGDTFQTPLGPAKVERYRDDNFMEIRLDPRVGKLLRFGHMLGRISKIDAENFIIDMSHPFGGEALQCEAVVLDAESDSAEKRELMERMKAELEQNFERQMETAKSMAAGENTAIVQKDDLTWVQYKLIDEKGRIWLSLFPDDTSGKEKKNASDAALRGLMTYFPLVAARQTDVPGLDLAVLGMQKGERKRVTLPPAKGFGQRDDKLRIDFERTQKIPVQSTLERALFEQQFKISPKEGAQLEMPPHGRATILKVTDQEVTFKLQAENRRIDEAIGATEVKVDQGSITYTLTPRIGAQYPFEGKSGTIVKSDAKTFTVDFNHPLAGQTVTLELLVHDFRKASALTDAAIEWVENYKRAQTIAHMEGKPIVLVLHAEWCSWCKRLFAETLADPIITAMRDRFVWVRIDSDKQKDYMTMFGQEGFPMMVLLDKQGQVTQKLQGFQQVYPLWENLQRALAR
jgi:FKBP-type peptidyl-prolyl cis-trans isomerase 2